MLTGPSGAHDFEIVFAPNPSETSIIIDGKQETQCRRIRVEQDMSGAAIVTLEVYARSVKVSGVADNVLELQTADDGNEVIEHNFGPGQPGMLRHYRRNAKGCHFCDPGAEQRERQLDM